jgi:protein-disulfide isomerase
MPLFQATNDFHCPYCNEMLNGASGFNDYDKPKHEDFTICVFCAQICIYVIEEGKITLRKVEEADDNFINANPALKQELEALIDFVKTRKK